mmetsp:Transcript_41926/g.82822  ORF Transcript_41926/g.82822 Transcript_41926/m.82822 type:complete len:286 (-) Transcript_41926:113-970(-)
MPVCKNVHSLKQAGVSKEKMAVDFSGMGASFYRKYMFMYKLEGYRELSIEEMEEKVKDHFYNTCVDTDHIMNKFLSYKPTTTAAAEESGPETSTAAPTPFRIPPFNPSGWGEKPPCYDPELHLWQTYEDVKGELKEFPGLAAASPSPSSLGPDQDFPNGWNLGVAATTVKGEVPEQSESPPRPDVTLPVPAPPRQAVNAEREVPVEQAESLPAPSHVTMRFAEDPRQDGSARRECQVEQAEALPAAPPVKKDGRGGARKGAGRKPSRCAECIASQSREPCTHLQK